MRLPLYGHTVSLFLPNGNVAVRATGLAGSGWGFPSVNRGPVPGVIRCHYAYKGNASGPAAGGACGPVLLRAGAACRGRGCGPAAEDRGCRTGAGRGYFFPLPFSCCGFRFGPLLRLRFRSGSVRLR